MTGEPLRETSRTPTGGGDSDQGETDHRGARSVAGGVSSARTITQ